MIQQVNLYKNLFDKKQAKPTTNKYLYGLALVILLLIAFSIYLFLDMKDTKNSLQEAKLKLQDTELQINELRMKYPAQRIDEQIIQEISQLQNVLTSLSVVLHLLTDEDSDQTQGFSRYFSAFSRQSIADVWLSNINIDAEKQSLTLQGSTFYPGKTPMFLQNLQHEPIFQGKSFAKLVMSQAEKNKSRIDFTISTTAEESDISEQKIHD